MGNCLGLLGFLHLWRLPTSVGLWFAKPWLRTQFVLDAGFGDCVATKAPVISIPILIPSFVRQYLLPQRGDSGASRFQIVDKNDTVSLGQQPGFDTVSPSLF